MCVVALATTGCTGEPIGPAISRDDVFTPYQEHTSSAVRPNISPDLMEYQMVGRRDRKTGVVTTLARVSIGYIGDVQRKYELARNNRAETLPLAVITRTSSGCLKKPCNYTEHMTVEIAERDLRSAAANAGYAFKVFSRIGNEHIIQVPKELIQSLFASMDRPNAPDSKATPSERRS